MNGQVAQFDHAVIMVRDQLDELAPEYERLGYTLSRKSVHNLGSCNRLIVLDGTYVELLGWPPGAPPARKEIADSPLGLEALVFRSHDAEATRQRLLQAGFAANPVQDLTRAADVDGRPMQAHFKTVRFAEQPLPGVRMYFCQHLTPECVWVPGLMRHDNGALRLARIDIAAADARATAEVLGRVVGVEPTPGADGAWELPLANALLRVNPNSAHSRPFLQGLSVADAAGRAVPMPTRFSG